MLLGSGNGPVATGDGGAASAAGASGDTGDAAAVLVSAYDGTGSGRSGRTGNVRSYARGGDAGCASSGIAPDKACRAEAVVSPGSQSNNPGTASPRAESATQTGTGPLRSTTRPAASGPAGTADAAGPTSQPTVRLDVRSSGSDDVTCVVGAGSRQTCRSDDTAPVRRELGEKRSQSDNVSESTAFTAVAAVQSSGQQTDDGSGATRTNPTPMAESNPSLIILLVNAAVPVLALLSITAMVMTRRRRRGISSRNTHVAKHRRKQPLPASVQTRQR